MKVLYYGTVSAFKNKNFLFQGLSTPSILTSTPLEAKIYGTTPRLQSTGPTTSVRMTFGSQLRHKSLVLQKT